MEAPTMFKFNMFRIIAVAFVATLFAESAVAQNPAVQSRPTGAVSGDIQVIPGKWTKICDPESAGARRFCMTTIDSYAKIKGATKPVWLASAAIREVQNEANKSRTIHFRVPLHVRLKEGILLRIDNGKVSKVDFEFCQAYGCEVVLPASDAQIERLKKGSQTILQFSDVRGNTHQVELTLAGFTKAFTGPPSQVLNPQAVSSAPGSGKGDAPAQ